MEQTKGGELVPAHRGKKEIERVKGGGQLSLYWRGDSKYIPAGLLRYFNPFAY
jgi:hypothetical protein